MASIDNILEVVFLLSLFFISLAPSIFSHFPFTFKIFKTRSSSPLEDNLQKIFLGLMGNPDPSRAIIAETNRIPFKHSNMHPNL
jgi:hypothetical protein